MGEYEEKILALFAMKPNKGYAWGDLIRHCSYPATYRGNPTTIYPRKRVYTAVMDLVYANKLHVTVPDVRWTYPLFSKKRRGTDNVMTTRVTWDQKWRTIKSFPSDATLEIRTRGLLSVMPGATVSEIAIACGTTVMGKIETHLLNLVKKGEAEVKVMRFGKQILFVYLPTPKLRSDVVVLMKELRSSRKPKHAPYWQQIHRHLRDDYLDTGALNRFSVEFFVSRLKITDSEAKARFRTLGEKGLCEIYIDGEDDILSQYGSVYSRSEWYIRLSPSELLKRRVERAKKRARQEETIRRARKRAPKATMNDIEP